VVKMGGLGVGVVELGSVVIGWSGCGGGGMLVGVGVVGYGGVEVGVCLGEGEDGFRCGWGCLGVSGCVCGCVCVCVCVCVHVRGALCRIIGGFT